MMTFVKTAGNGIFHSPQMVIGKRYNMERKSDIPDLPTDKSDKNEVILKLELRNAINGITC